jgi:putative ABC transport system permease protein
MESLLYDIRHAARMLRRSPGLTLIAGLALALGIGANTAIFSVVYAVVLKPLPYNKPQQLVQVWGRFTGIGIPDDHNAISAPEFMDLQRNSSFSHIAAIDDRSFNINFGATPERVLSTVVTPSFFPLLGVQAQVGRVFRQEEGEPGNEHFSCSRTVSGAGGSTPTPPCPVASSS